MKRPKKKILKGHPAGGAGATQPLQQGNVASPPTGPASANSAASVSATGGTGGESLRFFMLYLIEEKACLEVKTEIDEIDGILNHFGFQIYAYDGKSQTFYKMTPVGTWEKVVIFSLNSISR